MMKPDRLLEAYNCVSDTELIYIMFWPTVVLYFLDFDICIHVNFYCKILHIANFKQIWVAVGLVLRFNMDKGGGLKCTVIYIY